MLQLSSSKMPQRSERRIAVRLPLKVSGRDARGMLFQEETASENLCQNGAAFFTRFDVPLGCDLEIHIPFTQFGKRNEETDFATHGRVVHVGKYDTAGERVIGVQFTGPRFRRMFRSETAA
jgi:PilZ domain-containing protein